MKVFIAGGAGFIGSHLARAILSQDPSATVQLYDNLSSGKEWHFQDLKQRHSERLMFVKGDIKDIEALMEAMEGSQIVYHLAANADIAKAAKFPGVDFWEGTFLTHNVLECVRMVKPQFFLYTSGSGVYGDYKLKPLKETHAPMLPISTYGASKLGCEALICAYCHLFDLRAAAFRFANVVGPNQTHGVVYDFVRQLRRDASCLKILGDGKQSKSYLHVTDAVAAMRKIERLKPKGFSCFNIATREAVTVRQIAEIVLKVMDLKKVRFVCSGGNRGWKGDVPVVRLDSSKIRRLGWKNKFDSRQALEQSARALVQEATEGRHDV